MSNDPEFTAGWLYHKIDKHQCDWGSLPAAIHMTKKQLVSVLDSCHPDHSGIATYSQYGVPSYLFGIPVVLDDNFWLENPHYKETISGPWDGTITAGSMIIGDPSGDHVTIDGSGVKMKSGKKPGYSSIGSMSFSIGADASAIPPSPDLTATLKNFNESLVKASESMALAATVLGDHKYKASDDPLGGLDHLGGLHDDPAIVVFSVWSKDSTWIAPPVQVLVAKPPPYKMVHYGAVLDLSDLGLPERVRVTGLNITQPTLNERAVIDVRCWDYLGLLGDGFFVLPFDGGTIPLASFQ